MRYLIAARGLGLCLALGLGACSSEDTTGLDGGPKTCTVDQDCDSGETCRAGECVPPSTPECTVPEDCAPDGDCISGACVSFECTDHPDCADAELCIDRFCEPPPACTEDANCPDGTACRQEICTVVIACRPTGECPGDQVCRDGECAPPCTQDSDCGQAIRWACDTNTGECIPRCIGDGLCPDGFICEGTPGLCEAEECTEDSDCAGTNVRCENGGSHGRCVDFLPCIPGANDCPDNSVCDVNTNECVELPLCIGDRDCGPDEFCQDDHCQPTSRCTSTPCGEGFDCIGDRCVPALCRGAADCPNPGDICVAGQCQAPPGPNLVVQVVIITPAGVVRPGETYPFVAVAQDPSGRAIPGVLFTWQSSTPGVAAIDANGIATGGANAGTTQITASVTNSSGTITSAPVSLRNLGALSAGDVRVTAVAQAGGAPISGASVELVGSFGTQTQATDADGVTVFAGLSPTEPFTVTVAEAAHDYVSVVGVSGPDLLIPLPSITRTDRAGGARGGVDFNQVVTQGALSVSISGASFESPMFANDPGNLLGGDLFNVSIQIPGQGGFDVPVPAGTTVGVDFMGFQFDIKDSYYALARPGLRSVWSIAGRVGIDAIGLGGGAGGGNIIGAILPSLQRFEHGVRPVVPVLALPTIVDSADIDGDGDTTEMVPDYLAFPNVPMGPDTSQTLRYFLEVTGVRLPFVSGGNANTLLLVSGSLLPSVGFVPLGFDGLQDEQGNGVVDSFSTKLAPAHGGLEIGDYAVMAIALRLDQNGLPGPGSAQLWTGATLPSSVDFTAGFLDSPMGVRYGTGTRELSFPTVITVPMVHVAFKSDEGGWRVYFAPGQNASTLNVPAVPTGLVDRSANAEALITNVELEMGSSLDTVFGITNGGVLAIDRATRSFAAGTVEIE